MDEQISKSQKKRDADFLQSIGVKLIELSAQQLEELPLTESLLDAVLLAKSLKSHGAIRRQAQLIGKLMRNADSEKILAAYEQILLDGKLGQAKFHEIEHWRMELLNQNKQILTDFIEKYPQVDIQLLRQLIKLALAEKNTSNQQVLVSDCFGF